MSVICLGSYDLVLTAWVVLLERCRPLAEGFVVGSWRVEDDIQTVADYLPSIIADDVVVTERWQIVLTRAGQMWPWVLNVMRKICRSVDRYPDGIGCLGIDDGVRNVGTCLLVVVAALIAEEAEQQKQYEQHYEECQHTAQKSGSPPWLPERLVSSFGLTLF